MPLIELTKLTEILNIGEIAQERITINSDNIREIKVEPNKGCILIMDNDEKILVQEARTEILRLSSN